MDRFSEYRVMWVLVFFDLPTETKKERKAAADFRKKLLSDGFLMFQFSIYIRHCASAESAQVHVKILVFQFRIPIIPDFPLSGWQDGLVSGRPAWLWRHRPERSHREW